MSKKPAKRPPELDPDTDLARLFGVESKPVAPSADFSVELARLEAEEPGDPAAIIGEKQPQTSPKPSNRQRLSSYPPPREELDLHGCNAQRADIRTEAFVRRAAGRRTMTIRIITGKGLHSPGGAVLPGVVENRLNSLKEQGLILDWHWEKKRRQASGAVLVYLT